MLEPDAGKLARPVLRGGGAGNSTSLPDRLVSPIVQGLAARVTHKMDVLLRLQQWYAAQCDGDWEHQYGIRIETLDNPGWMVKIDVTGTALEGRPFTAIAEGVGADSAPAGARWIDCSVRKGLWQGACDESQLPRLLELFLGWVGE